MSCPICMSRVRELVTPKKIGWKMLARADNIVRRATFDGQAELARHLVTEHQWSVYSGTLRERS